MVEAMLLGLDDLLVVVAATEGKGVAETPLVLVQWGLHKKNRASSDKIILIFIQRRILVVVVVATKGELVEFYVRGSP